MGYVILVLLVAFLTIFILYMKDMIRKKAHSFEVFNNSSAEKADLYRWRGGVRYPAGYYKEEKDFYISEKKLRYPQQGVKNNARI